jgi:hypothetical protein
MRLWAFLGLLAALTACGTNVAPTLSCKPVAPIDLDARLVGDPAAGFAVTATAASRTGAEVELEVVLPDGVAHVAGPRKLKGRKVETRVDARVKSGGRQEILVRATFTQGGATMTRVVPLLVQDAAPARPGTPKKSARGDPILEFSP